MRGDLIPQLPPLKRKGEKELCGSISSCLLAGRHRAIPTREQELRGSIVLSSGESATPPPPPPPPPLPCFAPLPKKEGLGVGRFRVPSTSYSGFTPLSGFTMNRLLLPLVALGRVRLHHTHVRAKKRSRFASSRKRKISPSLRVVGKSSRTVTTTTPAPSPSPSCREWAV